MYVNTAITVEYLREGLLKSKSFSSTLTNERNMNNYILFYYTMLGIFLIVFYSWNNLQTVKPVSGFQQLRKIIDGSEKCQSRWSQLQVKRHSIKYESAVFKGRAELRLLQNHT